MNSDNANLWLNKALAILTSSNKPMSAKELHEQAGNEISLPHAILTMKKAAADNLVEAHKRANKKATLFSPKGSRKVVIQKSDKQTVDPEVQDVCYQLIGEMHKILQSWITDMANVDAQLAEALLKIKRK